MEKLYTVKGIAELLNVSKPTIQRYINTAAIEPDKEENQCRYYSYDKAVEIIKAVNAEFDISRIAADHEAPQNDAPQTATPPQNAEIDILKSVIATIQEQLVIKDKQIANMDRQIAAYEDQITDYSKRLKEALELTKGQQYIAAADKTAQIMDKESAGKENIVATNRTDHEIDQPEQPKQEVLQKKKKNFFARLLDL
jgi:DNA-binding transcriptional MerR regulator